MTIVGLLDADLQGGTEYRAGGIGPLFAQTRVKERFSIEEFLNRVLRACRAARLTNVVSLFVDELELYRAGEDEEDNLERVLKIARGRAASDEATSFMLMLSHEDDDLTHVISVEASTDHPADEPTITVLDTAGSPDAGDDDEGDDREPEAGEEEDDWEPAEGDDEELDEQGEAEEDPAGEARVQAFLERFLGDLTRELSLSEPELDVWIDREGEYDFNRLYVDAPPPRARRADRPH